MDNYFIAKCEHGMVVAQGHRPGPREKMIVRCPPSCDAQPGGAYEGEAKALSEDVSLGRS